MQISVILQKRFRNAHAFAYRVTSNCNNVQVSTLSDVADNKRRARKFIYLFYYKFRNYNALLTKRAKVSHTLLERTSKLTTVVANK